MVSVVGQGQCDSSTHFGGNALIDGVHNVNRFVG